MRYVGSWFFGANDYPCLTDRCCGFRPPGKLQLPIVVLLSSLDADTVSSDIPREIFREQQVMSAGRSIPPDGHAGLSMAGSASDPWAGKFG